MSGWPSTDLARRLDIDVIAPSLNNSTLAKPSRTKTPTRSTLCRHCQDQRHELASQRRACRAAQK